MILPDPFCSLAIGADAVPLKVKVRVPVGVTPYSPATAAVKVAGCPARLGFRDEIKLVWVV